MSTNQGLIQWKEFNSTIKQRVNTLYNVRLNPAQVMRFCTLLKNMKYYPSQNTIDDEIIRDQYDMWCMLSLQEQTEYLNAMAEINDSERASRTVFTRHEENEDPDNQDGDPINVMN